MVVAQCASRRQSAAGQLVLHVQRVVAHTRVGSIRLETLGQLVWDAVVETIGEIVGAAFRRAIVRMVGALVPDLDAVRTAHIGGGRVPGVRANPVGVPGCLIAIVETGDATVLRAAAAPAERIARLRGGALLVHLNQIAPCLDRQRRVFGVAFAGIPVRQIRAQAGIEQQLVRASRCPLHLLHALPSVIASARLRRIRCRTGAQAVVADLLVPEQIQLVALRQLECETKRWLQRTATT